MRRKERIAVDFDGTLTKWPFIISFLCSVINREQTPWFIHRPFWLIMEKFPVFPNYKRLQALKEWKEFYRFYIVSGRMDWTVITCALNGYRNIFDEIYVPDEEWCSNYTVAQYKVKVAKVLGIDYFFDDNRYIVHLLRQNGIKAMRP